MLTRKGKSGIRKGLLAALCAVLSGLAFVPAGPKQPPLRPYALVYDSLKMEQPYLPADNPLTVEGVELGRLLFYDPILSVNHTQSCGSCHQQALGFTDGRSRSVGALGDTVERNAMPLVNLAWSKFYFWDGRVKSLEKLVFEPITHPLEMGETEAGVLRKLNAHTYYPILFRRVFQTDTIRREHVEKAIAQFLRTIVSNGVTVPEYLENTPPAGMSEAEFYRQSLQERSSRGLFFRLSAMCSSCHRSDIYNDPDMPAVNNVNSPGQPMKVPTLLNIAHTGPYMHDGRYSRLEDILDHYNHNIALLQAANPERMDTLLPNLFIMDYDREMIGEFFTLFTDTVILTDPKWSDPFSKEKFSWETVLRDLWCEP